MTLQMMMATQYHGKLTDGWHLLARLHILEREFSRARRTEADWAAAKAGLGMPDYTLAAAQAISNNDWLVVSISWASGLDFRDYLRMWGQPFSTVAAAQVAAFGYPAAERRFFISSPNGFCKGEGFDGVNLPVDGTQVWP
ncbi:MAG: hypothetical protein KDI44_15480, partial [Thiothrix sp.]|nr:hypothetical protein [Thiothrix sp.]